MSSHLLFSQSGNVSYDNSSSSPVRAPVINRNQQIKLNSNPLSVKSSDEDIQMKMINNFHDLLPKPVQPTKNPFNIVSSFRENIHFGGYWNSYAIINFTPNINIKPLPFISIYANQNLSCFVPITGIKEHFEFLCVQGASIMVIDNAFKLLFERNRILPALIGFALKNLVMAEVMKKLNDGAPNKLYSYRSYFYSMSITF